MKKYNIIFLLLVAVNLQAQSQKKDHSVLNKTEFKIGYFGNMAWDNGLNLGVEYQWKENSKQKQKRTKKKMVMHQLLFNGNLGYKTNFSIETDNAGVVYLGMIWRRTNKKGRQLSFELNPLGYYRSFLPETYEVEGDQVRKVSMPGRSYYMPSFGIGIGKSRKDKTRSGWYFSVNFAFRTFYNAGTMPMVSAQYGYRFNFKR